MQVAMIAVEEHWGTPELARAVKAGCGDDGLALNERVGNAWKLFTTWR
jgi:hypothetical protein